ncbi:MAG TPA: fructose-bisphosphate aldolase, partial [Bacteroidota bacterium]|nr:fructose-bisphosphate aldolase [Bacteroidota bacterium]
MTINDIQQSLGADAKTLLEHKCKGIPKESLHLPGPDYVDRIYAQSDRPVPVLKSLNWLIHQGRLAHT